MECFFQGSMVSQAQRSDSVISPLRRRGQRKRRSRESYQERKKDKGEKESVAWMRVLRPSGWRRQTYQMVMLKQGVLVVACHPRTAGSCIGWSRRDLDPLLGKRPQGHPIWGVTKCDTDLGPQSLKSINIDEVTQAFQARLYWDSCYSRKEWEQVTGALARSPRSAGWFLKPGEGRGRIGGSGQSGGSGGLPTPWVVLCAGITHRTLLLLLAPEKRQLVCSPPVSYYS